MRICLKVRQVFLCGLGLLLLADLSGAQESTCKKVLSTSGKIQVRRSYLEVQDLRDLFVGRVQELKYRELPPEEGIRKAQALPEYGRLIESVLEHLRTVGLDYSYDGKTFVIRPSSATPLNRAARSLQREGLRGIEHDVAKSVIKRAIGSYSSQRQVMTISFQALVTARPDSNFVHESVHANMSRADKMEFFRPLLGRYRRHEPEKPGESGYEKYLNFQEIMTFSRDLRILVGQAEREGLNKEIRKKINQKVRRLRRFLEQAQAVEHLVSEVIRQASRATGFTSRYENGDGVERRVLKISDLHDLVLFPDKASGLDGVRVLVRGRVFEYDVFFKKSEMEEFQDLTTKNSVLALLQRIADSTKDLEQIQKALTNRLMGILELSSDNESSVLPVIRQLRGDIYEVLEQRISLGALTTQSEISMPWEDTFPLKGQDSVYRWFLLRAQPILAGWNF